MMFDSGTNPFTNRDDVLRDEAERVVKERSKAGLDGLTGGLQFVIINTEPAGLRETAREFLRYTGLRYDSGFEHDTHQACILRACIGADFLITSRKTPENPFASFNQHPKARQIPNSRLETFVFETPDLAGYVQIQKKRGVEFFTEEPIQSDHFLFIQTEPSRYTGNSVGLIQWTGERGDMVFSGRNNLDWELEKPDLPHLKNIHYLDHAATRV
ncbi:hypothetical protein HQ520_04955, partial [bacterium]|nr:hypothetical protein [bacterium]